MFYHVFSDAIRPADAANPQAVSISCTGDIVYSNRVNVNPVAKSSKIQGLLRLVSQQPNHRQISRTMLQRRNYFPDDLPT